MVLEDLLKVVFTEWGPSWLTGSGTANGLLIVVFHGRRIFEVFRRLSVWVRVGFVLAVFLALMLLLGVIPEVRWGRAWELISTAIDVLGGFL